MLNRIDRVQLAVPDRAATAARWTALLGAEPAEEGRVAGLAARRTRLRLGRGWIELLEPDGAGPVADGLARRGPHLFAAGAATSDMDGLIAHLEAQGLDADREDGQLHLGPAATGGAGIRVVVSADRELAAVGDIDYLYEVTWLAGDAAAATDGAATLFGLAADAFVPIKSAPYGYAGSLTLFRPGHLHRFEIITPSMPANTMGRFFGKFSDSLYMAFAETPALSLIAERARTRGDGHTPVPTPAPAPEGSVDTVFLHPSTLGGMMLGLSRPSVAWRWSGSPERVEMPA